MAESAARGPRIVGAVRRGLSTAQTLVNAGLCLACRPDREAARELAARRCFDALLADLAAAFIEIPAHRIDEQIIDGLRRTMEEVGLDRAGLAEFVPGTGELRVTHGRSRPGLSHPPAVFTPEAWPWTLARLGRGQEICLARLADLPADATRDRESLVALGTSAIALLPLRAGGEVLGALAGSTQRERAWAPGLVAQLRVLADLFAVVLMRQRADRALAASETRFHQMADAAPVLMWVAAPDGRCIACNRAWLTFTGRTMADEAADGWLDGIHADDRAASVQKYRAAVARREPFTLEYRLRRADGVYRSILDRGAPSFDATGAFQGYVGSAVDVTEVKQAQQELVESLALRSAIFGSLYGQVAALEANGVIIAVNEGWMSFLHERGGDPAAACVGVNYLDVCRRAAAAGDAHAQAALEALESVLGGQRAQAVLEYPCATASETEWYTMVVEPFRRPEGGLVVSHVNITRRRLAEEAVQRERAELAHALRVATLGGLATSLAHEINQPLAAIASNVEAAQHLLQGAAIDPDIPAAIADIGDAAQRAAQIIRRLRVLFRKEQAERHPIDLVEVIDEVVGLLHKEFEHRRVRVQRSLPVGLPRVIGDMVQLQQVILNVLVNAVEAMAGSTHPRELAIEAFLRKPARVVVTVADTGPGVTPSELEHIFERFVTSKPNGLGMGLSISRSIVNAHGGRIWATRNDERGLTLHIELPSLED